LVKASGGAAQRAEAFDPLALRTLSNSGNEGAGAAGETALTIHQPQPHKKRERKKKLSNAGRLNSSHRCVSGRTFYRGYRTIPGSRSLSNRFPRLRPTVPRASALQFEGTAVLATSLTIS
jgi:hypothetical protein